MDDSVYTELREKCKWEKLMVGVKEAIGRELKAERGRLAEIERERDMPPHW